MKREVPQRATAQPAGAYVMIQHNFSIAVSCCLNSCNLTDKSINCHNVQTYACGAIAWETALGGFLWRRT